jgi:hypothetical protein
MRVNTEVDLITSENLFQTSLVLWRKGIKINVRFRM